MKLIGKTALLVGGARIGHTVALSLADAGANLAVAYNRSRANAEQTVKEVLNRGRQGHAVQADVSDWEQVRALVLKTTTTFGGIDILVYMASVYRRKPFSELTEIDWDQNLNVDLKGAYLCARASAQSMRTRGGGRIITFADWIAASGRPRYSGYLPYYVAKYGIIGLTQALALELAPEKILVNCIAPGPILPPADMSPEEDAEVRRGTPLGRWGGPEEIARTVMSLVESDFITGECIRVDGGRHLR